MSKRHWFHKAIEFYDKELSAVDLHNVIAWHGTVCCTFEDLWAQREERSVLGLRVFQPCLAHELQIAIQHSLLQHHYTVLGDVLVLDYVTTLLGKQPTGGAFGAFMHNGKRSEEHTS